MDRDAPPLIAGHLVWQRATFRLDVQLHITAPAVGIYGPSGSGKSTLLRLIAGLEHPDSGWVDLAGQRMVGPGHWVPPERRRVACVFQDGRLFPHLGVRGNLRFGLRRARVAPPYSLEEILDLLQLGPLLHRSVRHLSGGEQQRVNLGRALLAGPRVLLLDEPLTGLDERQRDQVLPFLERIRDRLAVPFVYVSHHFAEIDRLCPEVIFLEHGALCPTDP